MAQKFIVLFAYKSEPFDVQSKSFRKVGSRILGEESVVDQVEARAPTYMHLGMYVLAHRKTSLFGRSDSVQGHQRFSGGPNSPLQQHQQRLGSQQGHMAM
jgi:hypothetical protein